MADYSQVRNANKPSMDWVGVDAEKYTLLGRLTIPRAAYGWMREQLKKQYQDPSIESILTGAFFSQSCML